MRRKTFKDLIIWQKSDKVFEMICEDVKKWPSNPGARAISYQLLDSGGSISSNIAEGYGRGSPGEFGQFLRISRGSTAETDNWLHKAMRQGLISPKRYDEYQGLFDEIGRMNSALIAKLRTQSKKKPKTQ